MTAAAKNICEILKLDETREHPMLACEGESLTADVFRERVVRRQAQLKAAGLEEDERCLVLCGRGNQVWIDVVALWGLGLTAVPLDASQPEETVRHMVALSGARTVLLDTSESTPGSSVLSDLCALPLGTASETPEPASKVTVRAVRPETLAIILFTSGSTGTPKGVPLSHRNLIANALGTRTVLPIEAGDRVFMAVPFRFVSALSHFIVVMMAKAVLIGFEKPFLHGDFIDALRACKGTAVGGNPRQMAWIAEASDRIGGVLSWAMSSGDHLPSETITALGEAYPGLKVQVAYGLTELGGRFCMLPVEDIPRKLGSVGKPVPGLEVNVLDDDGNLAASGESGRVFARGDCVFDGYYGSDTPLGPHGFDTGDIGRIDEEGYVYLLGRADDVFKSGGVKVSALTIADALRAMEGFSDVAVLPVDHKKLGKVPHAYVVMAPRKGFEKGAIMRALRETLPSTHLPFKLLAVDAIPRTGSGKVDRKRLRALTET